MHNPTYRVIQILNAVSAHNGELTLSMISRETGISVGTIHPILQTLAGMEFLSLDDTGRYHTGIRLYLDGFSFTDAAYNGIGSVIKDLRDKTQETCHYGTLEDGDVLYVIKEESPQSIRMYSAIGRRLPAYGTAVGKALLCLCSAEDLKAMYPDGLKKLTANTITDFSVLEEELRNVREEGFAREVEESNLGIRCLAKPVVVKGKVPAAVSVGIPVFRYDASKEEAIKRCLSDAVEKISKILAGVQA